MTTLKVVHSNTNPSEVLATVMTGITGNATIDLVSHSELGRSERYPLAQPKKQSVIGMTDEINAKGTLGERIATIEERMRHLPTLSQIQWLVISTAAASLVAMIGFMFSVKALGVDAFSNGFSTSQAIVQRDFERDKEMSELRSMIGVVAEGLNELKQKQPSTP